MDKFQPKESVDLQVDDLVSKATDTGSADKFSFTVFNQSPSDAENNFYYIEDESSLDDALANVHRLMDCLNDTEIEEPSFTSDDLAATAALHPATPRSVEELICELCGIPVPYDQSINGQVIDESKQLENVQGKNNLIATSDEKVGEAGEEKKIVFHSNATHFPEPDMTYEDQKQVRVNSQVAEISTEKYLPINKNNEAMISVLNKQKAISNMENTPLYNGLRPNDVTFSFDLDQSVTNSEKTAQLKTTAGEQALTSSETDNASVTKSRKSTKAMFKKANSENSNFFTKAFNKAPCSRCAHHHSGDVCSAFQELSTEQALDKKEKKKLSPTVSLPEKLLSNKRKVRLPLKRKTSKGKEPFDLRFLQANEPECSCFNVSDEGFHRNNSVFEVEHPKGILDEQQLDKGDKVAVNRKKNFWTKVPIRFRRSNSIDEEKLTEAAEVNKIINLQSNQAILVTLNERNPVVDLSTDSLVVNTSSDAAQSFAFLATDRERAEELKGHRLSGSPLMARLRTNLHHDPFLQCDSDVVRVDSEPRLPPSRDEFEFEDDKPRRRRATMDSASSHSTFRETASRRRKLIDHMNGTTAYKLLPRQMSHDPKRSLHLTSSQFNRIYNSDGSIKKSRDNLKDDDTSGTPVSRAGRVRGGIIDGLEKHELEYLRSRNHASMKSGKMNILRKSMKLVSKSVPAYDFEDDKDSEQYEIKEKNNREERTWLSEGNCSWKNMKGTVVQLESTRLQSLSELECDALKKVSISRLHEVDLGMHVVVPKDESKILNRKGPSKKKYHLLKEKHKNKDGEHVFGITLVNVVENDQLLRLQKSFTPSLDLQQHPDSPSEPNGTLHVPGSNLSIDSSSSSDSTHSIHASSQPNDGDNGPTSTFRSLNKTTSSENFSSTDEVAKDSDNVFHKDENPQATTPTSAKSVTNTASQPLRRRGAIPVSKNVIDPYQSQLLEALSLSVSGSTTHSQKKSAKSSLLPPTMAQVPYVVQKCCDHLQKYGLNQAGIFRVPGSKKRVKQLREQFDQGNDVTIDETYNPHDVAALLKEFFRDLPEALLTRELYPAFLQTTKLSKPQERLSCLRYLIWLLPLTHRDTLHTLLQFLALVASHAEESTDRSGNKVMGNKMTVSNLATIFGPNVLHRYKKSTSSNGDGHYQVQSLEKAEETNAVIKAVADIINHHNQLFLIPREEHDRMLKILQESDPEAVNFLLRRKEANQMREKAHLLAEQATPSFPTDKPFSQPRDSIPEAEDPAVPPIDAASKLERNLQEENTSPSVPAVMRASYQQATGHLQMPASHAKDGKMSALKFKRDMFKKGQQKVQSPSKLDIEGGSTGTPTNNKVESSTNERAQLKSKDNSFDDALTTSSKCRSMSFTDDELQAILSAKSDALQKSRNRINSDPKMDVVRGRDHGTLREEENGNESSVRVSCGDEKGLSHQVNDVIRAAKSSDSGVDVDSSRTILESSPTHVRRRGGFEVETSYSSGAYEQNVKVERQTKSVENRLSKLSFIEDREQMVRLGIRKDSGLDNSDNGSEITEDPIPEEENSAVELSNLSPQPKSGVEASPETPEIAKTKPKTEQFERQLDGNNNSDSSSALKSPNVMSCISLNCASTTDSQASFKDTVCSSLASSGDETIDNIPSRLHSCCETSSQLASALRSDSSSAEPEPQCDAYRSQGNPAHEANHFKLHKDLSTCGISLSTGHYVSEKRNVFLKAPVNSRRASPRGTNVATLAKCYSKNDIDLNVTQSSKSKWTSSGLVGNLRTINQAKREPLNHKNYFTARSEVDASRDKAANRTQLLPETFV